MSRIFDGLNEAQKQAVMTTDGPLMIVAGPGTGKTLTMVRRIAYLVQQGVKPDGILAVTFTNRAAREMKERTEALLGKTAAKIFIGTFHLLGLRIIKESRQPDFVLYGREEQVELLKSIMKESTKRAQQSADFISRIKNDLEKSDTEAGGIFEAYQAGLRDRNAVDFDDLIRVPIGLLEQGTGASDFQDRFTHIIVDEYQDINPAQYHLLKLLTGTNPNLCVVGDADQAIYAFRGADLGNFLNFDRDYPAATRITLKHNYRSTGGIVHAADSVIRNNQRRIAKELVSTREQGRPVTIVSAPDEGAEADLIISEIEARMGGTSHDQMRRNEAARDGADRSHRFSDFAVIYRTNAQAKALEEAFNTSGIPYQLIGRKGALQSKEIEETTAFLRSLLRRDETTAEMSTDSHETKLLSPADFFDARADAVALMTLHMAKGLEFPVVFVTGVENGLLPCSIMKDVDIEEERRLFYVGVTRAKDELYLIHTRKRFLYGQRLGQMPSPYLSEIPDTLVEKIMLPDVVRKQKEPDRQMGLF